MHLVRRQSSGVGGSGQAGSDWRTTSACSAQPSPHLPSGRGRRARHHLPTSRAPARVNPSPIRSAQQCSDYLDGSARNAGPERPDVKRPAAARRAQRGKPPAAPVAGAGAEYGWVTAPAAGRASAEPSLGCAIGGGASYLGGYSPASSLNSALGRTAGSRTTAVGSQTAHTSQGLRKSHPRRRRPQGRF